MVKPVYDDCRGCGGTGQAQDWTTGNLIECPYCRGLGREIKVVGRSCPACEGTGKSTAPVEPGLFICPACKGTGKMTNRQEKQRRDPYIGMADRIERNFMKIGLGVLLVYILFIFAIIGALIALIIYLV